MKVLYTAKATSTGEGRNGHVRSSDGLVDTDVAVPAEMGGPGGATNPEQLFAAGYAACFHSALNGVARRAKTTVDGSEVTGEVSIGPTGGGGYGLAVTLKISVPGMEQEKIAELVATAHQVCPYSNATRGNINVALEIV